MARVWPMFAHDFGTDGPGVRFRSVYDREMLTRMASSSMPAVPVLVTEDPDGEYHAWQETGETNICIVYAKPFFDIAFPAGAAAAEARGRGKKLTVRIDRTDEQGEGTQ